MIPWNKKEQRYNAEFRGIVNQYAKELQAQAIVKRDLSTLLLTPYLAQHLNKVLQTLRDLMSQQPKENA